MSIYSPPLNNAPATKHDTPAANSAKTCGNPYRFSVKRIDIAAITHAAARVVDEAAIRLQLLGGWSYEGAIKCR